MKIKHIVLTSILALTMVFTVACATSTGGNGDSDTIRIGTQTYSETKALAYMFEALIEDRTDYQVSVTPDLASSPVIIGAMDSNEIDLATLYTGEIFNNYFEVEETFNRQAVLEQAQSGFDEHHNFTWFDPYGFENTYAFTVRADVAEEHGLEKVSDLHDLADQMILGTDTSWLERGDDGYRAFSEHYGLDFPNTRAMEISLVYGAVANEEVDIVLAYSTDARLVEYDLVTLEDDLQFFPPYDASAVAKNEMLENFPGVEDVISLLSGMMDEEMITEVNYLIDIENRDEREVAVEFLRNHGLLD